MKLVWGAAYIALPKKIIYISLMGDWQLIFFLHKCLTGGEKGRLERVVDLNNHNAHPNWRIGLGYGFGVEQIYQKGLIHLILFWSTI